MRLQKEQQTDNKQKINLNLPENAVEAVKPLLVLKTCSIAPSANTDNVVCALSLLKVGKKWTKRKNGKIV